MRMPMQGMFLQEAEMADGSMDQYQTRSQNVILVHATHACSPYETRETVSHDQQELASA
jgi:hypothetical protein